jgi:hypothetical protein
MNRVKLAKAMLAALLVVMLPLEQAHCACVAMAQRARAPMAAAAGAGGGCHAACCATHGAVATRPAPNAPAPRGCPCEKLTATDLPQVLAVAHADVPAPTFVLLSTPDPVAPRTDAVTTAPALDVGVPPPLIDPGAHGLRAPPLFS